MTHTHQHPMLPCTQALQSNCSASERTCGARSRCSFSRFQPKLSRRQTFPVSLECLLFQWFSKERKQQQQQRERSQLGVLGHNDSTRLCLSGTLSDCLPVISASEGNQNKLFFFPLFVVVFLSFEKAGQRHAAVFCTTKALHKACNISHLTHVAIPTGRAEGRVTHQYLSSWMTCFISRYIRLTLYKYKYINTCCTDLKYIMAKKLKEKKKQQLLEKNIYFYCFII